MTTEMEAPTETHSAVIHTVARDIRSAAEALDEVCNDLREDSVPAARVDATRLVALDLRHISETALAAIRKRKQ
jgi:hypothetical protein